MVVASLYKLWQRGHVMHGRSVFLFTFTTWLDTIATITNKLINFAFQSCQVNHSTPRWFCPCWIRRGTDMDLGREFKWRLLGAKSPDGVRLLAQKLRKDEPGTVQCCCRCWFWVLLVLERDKEKRA